jgi:IS5 family transposase
VEQTKQFLAELEGKDFKFASVADEVQYDVCKAEIKRVYELACKISNVARRRVVEKEKVPASEKIFSIFEVHTDIITKGKRDSEFGHKILLAGGKSGLIHSVETLSGNPADSKLFTKAMDNHVKIYGVAPEKVATDGCFGSKENQEYAKKIGVKELTFCKRRSLDILSSEKIKENFTKLKNFRAGIEGDISYCKRKLVMGKILAKGLGSFKSSIQVSVITKNLITIARIQITKRLKKVSRTLKKAA